MDLIKDLIKKGIFHLFWIWWKEWNLKLWSWKIYVGAENFPLFHQILLQALIFNIVGCLSMIFKENSLRVWINWPYTKWCCLTITSRIKDRAKCFIRFSVSFLVKERKKDLDLMRSFFKDWNIERIGWHFKKRSGTSEYGVEKGS